VSGPRLTALVAGVVALVTASTGLTACSGGKSSKVDPPKHANVVLVLADDLDLREVQYLPHVQSLIAKQGATLDNYFISNSLCCPSRTTMLLGQYAHDTGVLANAGTNGGFEALHARDGERSSVATWLHDASYDSALVGKYLNGYPTTAGATYQPPGWTDWWGAIDSDQAYGEYDYDVIHDGARVHHGKSAKDYGTTVYTDYAQQFVHDEATKGRSFFLDLAFFAPHQPATPAPRDLNAVAPRPRSFDEPNVADKPAYLQALPRLSPDVIAAIDRLYRNRIRSLQAVDRSVAALVDQLQKLGILDDTYFVFTSDNGFHLGEHRLPAGKRTPYDDDIHVPFYVRGPGIAAGSTVHALAGNVDLAPTLAAIAGAKVPSSAEGRSLLDLWHGHPTPADWRTGYLLEHAPEPSTGDRDIEAGRGVLVAAEPTDIPSYEGVRTGDASYVEYATGERELYDLRADPFELQNLARTAAPSLLAQWHDYLAPLQDCHGADCRAAESRPAPPP
jgi:N-acetylglucosamine-6-sulfatase